MKYVGAHVSVEGGMNNAPQRAHEIGAKAFALFPGFSSRWSSPTPKPEVIKNFKERCEEYGYPPHLILAHSNFLINLGSPDEEKRAKSLESFIAELKRCRMLGITLLNFHPGSHLKQISTEECLHNIAVSVNKALSEVEGITAVLENTAGQGSNLGFEFGQLAQIISEVEDKSRIGVCIDTCHAYSAGYDLATEEGYEKVWNEFDSTIGFEYLRGMHINDDMRELGSKIDRHASLLKGSLGEAFFERLMNDPRFDNIPLILETPDDSIWAQEIEWLYSKVK